MKKQYAISRRIQIKLYINIASLKKTYNSYFFNIIQVPTGYKLLFF